MSAGRAHDQFCTLPTDHLGPCLEHYCDCDRCGFFSAPGTAEAFARGLLLDAVIAEAHETIANLESQVRVLEESLQLSETIARTGLLLSAATAAERPTYCPDPNPLNGGTSDADPRADAHKRDESRS